MSWDKDVPAPGIQARYVDDGIRTNNAALEDALGRDHVFPGVMSSTAGMHGVVQLTDQAGDEAVHATAVKIWNNAGVLRAIAPGGSAQSLGFLDGYSGVLNAPTGTVMLFGQNSAPTGWTRKADWQDNAMLCYAASGNIGSGGAVNAQSAHTHTGPSHTHTGPSHTHTGPSHTHTAVHDHTAGQHRHIWYDYGASGGQSYNAAGSLATVVPADAGSLVGIHAGRLYEVAGDFVTVNEGRIAIDQYTNLEDVSIASFTGSTGAEGTGATGAAGTGATSASGTAATGSNSTPFYQEIIAATKV